MKWHIARMRLVSVGPEPARYDPLELRFIAPDGSGPADSVLLLPNTGGKTVLLRLIFSVLHPPAVEKIGSEETSGRRIRNLPGYVLERDTAHVAIEWRRAQDGQFIDDRALVTGLVAEWRGGRVTDSPTTDLLKVWYAVEGDGVSLDLDALSVDAIVEENGNATRRRYRLRQFRERLEESGRQRGAPQTTVTDVQRDWVEHLDAVGLDHALFRYQADMNHNEAGASAIARFREDVDFVKFFLKAVFDPAELGVLDREFAQVADKVRRHPEYEQRLRFGQAALAELSPLVELVQRATKARQEFEAARQHALDLGGAFARRAETAREEERVARERMSERDREARRLLTTADKLRDEAREYRKLAAEFWVGEATKALEAARERSGKAELEVRGWTVAEELAHIETAEAEVRALETAYAVELERLRPLQDDRDDTGRRLWRRIAADAVIATDDERKERERASTLRVEVSAARARERETVKEAARLDGLREAGELRLAEIAARRTALVTQGLLDKEEPAAEAQQREEGLAAAAFSRVEAIDVETTALHSEREALDQVERLVAPERTRVQRDLDRATSELERADAERAELRQHPTVRELAEAEEFDLELIGPRICERLHGRLAEADRERVNLELRGIEDRRAVSGLDACGLLPPPREVEAAIQLLSEAGVSGAIAGTRFLAEAVGASERARVVRHRADLVGGIVLTSLDDVARARAILEAAQLNPSMIIAVGPSQELIAAENAPDDGRASFVIPPAESLWDPTASAAERVRRDSSLAALSTERGRLETRVAGARTLVDALDRHAQQYPPGWRARRGGERAAFAIDVARLDAERSARDARKTQITGKVSELREEAARQRTTGRAAQKRAATLAGLVEEEAKASLIRPDVERQRLEAERLRGVAKAAADAATTNEGTAQRAEQAARDHQSTAGARRRELASIKLAETPADPTFDEAVRLCADRGLAELRALFEELDRKLSAETSSSDVAARRNAAISTRDRLRAPFELHPEPLRVRAHALLGLPEGGDLLGRRAALGRADAELVAAKGLENEAFGADLQARTALQEVMREVQSARRSIKLPAERRPRDRQEATRLAEELRLSAEATQQQVSTAERDRELARGVADAAKGLADALTGFGAQLRVGLGLATDAALPAVPPFPGGVDAAGEAALSASQRIKVTSEAREAVEAELKARDAAVRGLLAREEFAALAVSDRLYRRLAQSSADLLARDAQDLVAELRASIGVLQSELATMAQDVRLATTSLAKSTNKALSYLRLAETRSRMPDSLRDWAGHPFLTVAFQKPPADELEARLRTLVTDLVSRPADLPKGTELLLTALDRAVGEFQVHILKPNQAFTLMRVPIAELSSPTFSNGQRSTVATALMLMFSELRRQSRAAATPASVGTLLLDNPFGNANAGFLIEVQRTVARAAGIQLVYLTGIADHNSLRHFPNVIALSNDAARRTLRRYVRANPELLAALIPAEPPPGGRVSASSVVPLATRDGP